MTTTQHTTPAITVTLDKAVPLVIECVKVNKPVMLHGGTGVGKTDLFRQIAATLNMPIRTTIASIKTPVDLGGVPVPDMVNGVCQWLKPSDFPRVDRDGEEGIWFFDEINACAPSMQAALFQLILEGRVNDHEVPKGWRRVAAGNRLMDRAAAQRMPSALRNRFVHFNVEPDVKAWSNWAATAGVDPYLVAFLNFRPALLHVMPGATVDEGDMKITMDPEANAFPTPRSWSDAGKFLNLSADLRLPLVSGTVGEGPARELEGFLRVCHACPTLDDVIAHPATAKVPGDKDPASKYAITALLCRSANRDNFDAIMEYAARLGREYEVLTAFDAVKRHPDLAATSAFGSWAVSNQDITL